MKIRLIHLAALATALLAGCSQDDNLADIPQNALPDDGIIRISTRVNSLVATRNATQAYAGTKIGLYIKPIASDGWEHKAGNYVYPNVQFTTTDGGATWSQNEYTPMLWKGENVQYQYYAYAPADPKAVDDKVSFDLSKQHEQSEVENDLLCCNAGGLASSMVKEGKLTIRFGHKLCKVAVEVTLADEFYQSGNEENPVQSITITSPIITGTLNVLENKIESTTSTTDEIPVLTFGTKDGTHTAGTSGTPGTYTTPYLFYAPSKVAFTVKITTTAGKTYTYTHGSKFTFAENNQYLIKLKMGKSILQAGDNISAKPWETVTPENDGKLETE